MTQARGTPEHWVTALAPGLASVTEHRFICRGEPCVRPVHMMLIVLLSEDRRNEGAHIVCPTGKKGYSATFCFPPTLFCAIV